MKRLISKTFAIVFLILVSGCGLKDENHSLRGTYLCKKLPRVTMVFDQEDHNKFYYYNPDLSVYKKVDTGTYVKKSNLKYVITNNQFNNKELTLSKKGFTVFINSQKYYFYQFSSVPTIEE
ncbi:lipoprotein [Bacillus sp. AFS017336]|uniref:LptM family lipoprotein n=1 Tax=Bacillus sp. AFS017336 TaxID=2033489 RepID=UPI000BF005E2|nr:hypothetical protein [Bacillus sp. AFS017336]PEL13968.1 hypothetical protein CN601_02665 [Bacillus sp. AFS017336]